MHLCEADSSVKATVASWVGLHASLGPGVGDEQGGFRGEKDIA